jgi:hypothetical protein
VDGVVIGDSCPGEAGSCSSSSWIRFPFKACGDHLLVG